MKLILIAMLYLCSSAVAQTNLRTVMVNTNGIVERPANFWATNAASINAAVSFEGVLNERLSTHYVTFADLPTQIAAGGNAVTGASTAALSVEGTNASGFTAMRLMRNVNAVVPAGVGTRFNADSHEMWMQVDGVVSTSSVFRAVLGNVSFGTNFGAYPTSHAFGFEIRGATNDFQQIRLIAHNGITSTNGPWVAFGTVFSRHWLGVKQNKTNGQITLFHTTGLSPTNVTSATISGGPTNSAGTDFGAWDVRMETSGTNAANSAISIYSAFIDITD